MNGFLQRLPNATIKRRGMSDRSGFQEVFWFLVQFAFGSERVCIISTLL